MSTEADIVERLGDFDNHGLTATERFKLRMDAYNEIKHLRAQRDAARTDAYRAMCEVNDLRAERDAAARDMRERAAHAGYVACAETRHVTLGKAVSAAIMALPTTPTVIATDQKGGAT